MLDADDRKLVDREHDLPGLELILDPEAVAATVTAATGRACGPLVATHIRYKPATSCVVGYRPLEGSGEPLFAKAVRPSDVAKVDKSVAKALDGPGWPVIPVEDLGTYVAGSLQDRHLPAARVLGDPKTRVDLLRRLLPGEEQVWSGDLSSVRHKPERRWIGVVEVDGVPMRRLKAYRTGGVDRALAGHSIAGADGPLPIGWSRRRSTIASAWIPGEPLSGLLASGSAVDLTAVGLALARVHRGPISEVLPSLTVPRLRPALHLAAGGVADIVPDLAERAAEIAHRAGRGLPSASKMTVIHGDFSADQVVVGAGGRVDLIDFDEAANGDPAADLASFEADLWCAEIDGLVAPGTARRAIAGLLDGYRTAGGPADVRAIDAHLPGELLRRAVLAFRDRRPAWEATCRSAVQAAEESLSERTGDRR